MFSKNLVIPLKIIINVTTVGTLPMCLYVFMETLNLIKTTKSLFLLIFKICINLNKFTLCLASV